MNYQYLLLVILVLVVAAGLVYILRPSTDPDLSFNPLLPSPSPIDNTIHLGTPKSKISIPSIAQKVDVTLVTSLGNIDLTLDGTVAPFTVGNFVQLAKKDFYDGTTWHRVIPDFMIQGGDPLSIDPNLKARHGTGGPGYKFKDEINDNKMVRGAIAMANSGPNTNGSQFFIVVGEAFPHLDGKHTVFGVVTAGMDVVDKIAAVPKDAADNPLEPVIITDIKINSDISDPLRKL